MGSGVGEGSTGCVLEAVGATDAVGASGLLVGLGVAPPVNGMMGSSVSSTGAAGAQAERITNGSKSRENQNESRKLSFILTFFPGCDLY
jgi:hypothetical protein